MDLYTRSGDDGSTGLFGGDRVTKDHARVAAYGTIDETNALLGWAAVACRESDPLEGRLLTILRELQSRLFDLGADLATPADSPHADKVRRMSTEHVAELEAWIDEIDGGNAPMQTFILPGGSELAARLHVARTVCRRAERAVATAGRGEDLGPVVLPFVNRISDLLFAMARRANANVGVEDVPWTAG